jgi:rubredoxin
MKILYQGSLKPRDDRPWWLRCKNTCVKCGAIYVLEEGDPVDVVTERTINGESIATSTCPTCGFAVITYRSSAEMVVSGETP